MARNVSNWCILRTLGCCLAFLSKLPRKPYFTQMSCSPKLCAKNRTKEEKKLHFSWRFKFFLRIFRFLPLSIGKYFEFSVFYPHFSSIACDKSISMPPTAIQRLWLKYIESEFWMKPIFVPHTISISKLWLRWTTRKKKWRKNLGVNQTAWNCKLSSIFRAFVDVWIVRMAPAAFASEFMSIYYHSCCCCCCIFVSLHFILEKVKAERDFCNKVKKKFVSRVSSFKSQVSRSHLSHIVLSVFELCCYLAALSYKKYHIIK